VQERVLLGTAIACAVLLLWAMFRTPQRPLSARLAPWLLVASIACVGAGASQHFFGRAYYFDVGDNFHYYLGAKYSHELRYDRHYECVATALESQGRTLPGRYRDLRDNRLRKTADALQKGARETCLKAFSTARWESFQQDVRLYRNWHPFERFEHRFKDHGYNGTPVWTVLAGSLANAVPLSATSQTWLAQLNLVFLAAALGLVIRAFGWELGLLYSILFWVQYADRFALGGAFLRYLPISLLSAGAALYKLERPGWAGVCVGMAAGLLVFPGLFLAAATAYLVLSLARDRALTPEGKATLRFLIVAGCTLAACIVLSAVYAGGFETWQAFFEKMRLNSGRLAIGRIGFLFNFLWPKPITTDPNGYDSALALLHNPGPLGLSLNHLRWVLASLLVGALVFSYRKASALSFTIILGFALFFIGFPTVRYYYMGFVALPLALHAAPASHGARAILAALCLLSAACYALDGVASHAFLHNTLLSMGLTAVLIALAVPKVAMSLRGAE